MLNKEMLGGLERHWVVYATLFWNKDLQLAIKNYCSMQFFAKFSLFGIVAPDGRATSKLKMQ